MLTTAENELLIRTDVRQQVDAVGCAFTLVPVCSRAGVSDQGVDWSKFQADSYVSTASAVGRISGRVDDRW